MIQTSQANRDIMADPLTRSLDEVLFGRQATGAGLEETRGRPSARWAPSRTPRQKLHINAHISNAL
jgi:hypothetical protein